jgi:hypothetical protein
LISAGGEARSVKNAIFQIFSVALIEVIEGEGFNSLLASVLNLIDPKMAMLNSKFLAGARRHDGRHRRGIIDGQIKQGSW